MLQICKKMTLYNPNLDLDNDNMYSKFGLISSILSQDIEQKLNSYVNQGQICQKYAAYNRNTDLDNDMYTEFGFIRQFVLKILSKILTSIKGRYSVANLNDALQSQKRSCR